MICVIFYEIKAWKYNIFYNVLQGKFEEKKCRSLKFKKTLFATQISYTVELQSLAKASIK